MDGALDAILKQIPYIREVNAIHPIFAKEQSLSITSTDIGVQKIDSFTLDIYEVVVVAFLMTNKINQSLILE